MLLHSPATREQLESLGIPVLIERSSYETHPLGRMEWIKLYALLVGREEEAEAFFERETAALSDVLNAEPTGKRAAFFYVSPNGWITVRRAGDYIPKMIELAGGVYVPSDMGGDETAQSSMNLQPEAFYAGAKDADVLIYNSNIYPVDSVARLVEQNDLFADFKAVREGNVWATEQNVFQQTTAVAAMIADFRAVLTGEGADKLTYLHKLT
jgi:iron complex transport system substrate-binding protein